MKNSIIMLLLLAGLASCKKMIEIESPKSQLSTDKVFTDTVSATAALLNIYDGLQNQQYVFSNQYLSLYADEALATATSLEAWNQSRLTAAIPLGLSGIWSNSYSAIYQSTLIMEQLRASSRLPAAFINKTQAEAQFLRAYAYCYLINYFGPVPLVLSTDVNKNRSLPQSDSASVYQQIVTDLTAARANLPVAYQGAGKVRANKACATALLAKVYLFQRNWAMAEALSDELITSGTYTPLEPLANVFKATGKESILQLGTQTGFVTEAGTVIPSSATVQPAYFFTDGFYQSFEAVDQRKTAWVGTNTVSVNGSPVLYRYPHKYKNRVANTSSPENLVVLRIAEQYLIRAESRAWQGKFTGAGGAAEDLNVVRARAGLGAVQLTDLKSAVTAVLNERRHELFFENGSRFMDLKRTGNLLTVMSAAKPTWITTSALLPIPATEIIYNPNLIQNDGY